MTEVYKVVREENGKFLSWRMSQIICDARFVLEYDTEHITVPRIGKIFAFRELHFAKRFASPAYDRIPQIWLAETSACKIGLWFCTSFETFELEAFWIERWNQCCDTTPYGTLYCDDLILKERVA